MLKHESQRVPCQTKQTNQEFGNCISSEYSVRVTEALDSKHEYGVASETIDSYVKYWPIGLKSL